MVEPVVLLLGAALLAAPTGDTLLGPLSIARPREGPVVVVREQSGVPLVAIRLSVEVGAPQAAAGAGRALQLLVRDRLVSETERFGARIEFTRSPTHLVYQIVGPTASFSDMVAALRYAVAPPEGVLRASEGALLVATREALSGLETAEGVVRRRLQEALFPELAVAIPPAAPDAEGVGAFWRRWFQPKRMAVVVVGPIAPQRVLAAFRGWTAPPATGRAPPPPLEGEVPSPEVIFPRAGVGYGAGAADPAAIAVVASLVEGAIPELGLRQGSAEVWWAEGKTALVLVGSAPAPTGMRAAAVAERLQRCVAGVAAALTPEAVERHTRLLRHSLLLRARTPEGMAALLGDFMDRTGEPEGALLFLDALAALDEARLRDTFEKLLAHGPAVVELDP
jgi:predicted Zn-dependent peptidase